MKLKLKSFTIETFYPSGKNVFCTKARNGKEALKNLINKSGDYNQILTNKESNNMIIIINNK